MIFGPQQQFSRSDLPIIKIVLSPDKTFDALGTTLFKRELWKKVFMKKRCDRYLMIWWRDWSVMGRMLEAWGRWGGHHWVPITRVGRGWGHNVSLWGCRVSIVSPVVIWRRWSWTLWGCQFLASILKDPFDVETIGSASLVVGAPFQIIGQFSGSRIINHARLVFTDGIC